MVSLALAAVVVLQAEKGLRMETLQVGSGALVTAAAKVEIDFTVRGVNGKALRSSLDQGLPLWVNLSDTKTFPIWRKGLPGLKVGGRRKITASPYWYGGAANEPILIIFVTVRAIK